MTRKEVVKRAIHFQSPPYVPLMYYGTDRIAKSDAVMLGVQEMYGGEDGRVTEWGFNWAETGMEFKLGVVKDPAITDWDQLATEKHPDAPLAETPWHLGDPIRLWECYPPKPYAKWN